MKKLLLPLILIGSLAQAQTLLTENFNALTIGNVGTSTTGATAGQGGWFTNASTTDTGVTNASFQIVANDAAHVNVLKITGSNSTLGSRYASKSISTAWAARTAGNNIVQVEFDLYTGPATTSKNASRLYIYDATLTKILSGVSIAQDTKAIQGVAYYDATASNGSVANYGFYLGGTAGAPADLNLTPGSWVRIGVAFDKTTGNSYWKGPGFNTYVAGAAAATDPLGVYMLAYSGGTSNALSADHLFDNITVTAVSAVNLLGTTEVSGNQAAELSIYPNPAKDFISIAAKEKVESAYIYDVSGKRFDARLNENNVDVSSLAPGNYLLGIKTKDGFVTRKFTKK